MWLGLKKLLMTIHRSDWKSCRLSSWNPDTFLTAIGLGSADFEGTDGLSITFSAPMSFANNRVWTFVAGVLDQTLIGFDFTQCIYTDWQNFSAPPCITELFLKIMHPLKLIVQCYFEGRWL